MTALFGLALMQTSVALNPVPRLTEDWWKNRHQNCLAITKKGGVDVAFLGDSITQGWESTGKKTWEAEFAPLKSANFGYSGDRTEHVLWRLNQGELIPLQPKVVVIMIGTNNVGHGSSNSEQTAEGVKAIVGKILAGSPKSKILLLGIFPRGEEPNDDMRLKVNAATAGFKSLHDGDKVHFLDIGSAFTRRNGVLRTGIMPDRLHLNEGGYEIWAKSIKPTLMKLLG